MAVIMNWSYAVTNVQDGSTNLTIMGETDTMRPDEAKSHETDGVGLWCTRRTVMIFVVCDCQGSMVDSGVSRASHRLIGVTEDFYNRVPIMEGRSEEPLRKAIPKVAK